MPFLREYDSGFGAALDDWLTTEPDRSGLSDEDAPEPPPDEGDQE